MPSGSITHLISALKNGDRAAAQPLWERYYGRLLGLARQKLTRSNGRREDEEDVVQNAFNSFFQGMAGGRFPHLDDRTDLWRLLVVITARKSIDLMRREHRGGRDVTLGAFSTISEIESADEIVLEEIVAREPTPELAAQLVEQFEYLLHRLADPTLQQVAIWKLEGFNNGEIADKLGCARRTVIRKLETIRLIWNKDSKS